MRLRRRPRADEALTPLPGFQRALEAGQGRPRKISGPVRRLSGGSGQPPPAETACGPLGRGGAELSGCRLTPAGGWITTDSRRSHDPRPPETHLRGGRGICYSLILTESRRLNPVMHFIVVRAAHFVSSMPQNADRGRNMSDLSHIFNCITDPRRSNAMRHDFHKMLMTVLPTVMSGGETCADTVEYAEIKKKSLLGFMDLKHGATSRAAFSDLFDSIDPLELGIVPASGICDAIENTR